MERPVVPVTGTERMAYKVRPNYPLKGEMIEQNRRITAKNYIMVDK